MHLSDFEKMLIARRLIKNGKGRDAAKRIVQTIKYAATPEGAVKLLKMDLLTDDAETVVELSRECEELWGQKRQIAVEGVSITGTKGAYLKKSIRGAVLAAELAVIRLQLFALQRQMKYSKGALVKQFSMIQTKFAPGSTGKLKGYASTAAIDMVGHSVLNGAFTDSIKARGLKGPTGVKLLLDHDASKPAGTINKLYYDANGLVIDCELDLSIQYVADRFAAIKAMGGLNFSVGFTLQDYSWKKSPVVGEFLEIQRGDLLEVSIVTFPANEEAVMTEVKAR